jgi:pimeloyl-ACP methyl ester carboxylesterase
MVHSRLYTPSVKPPLLHASIRGEGPTLVLLHGFLSSSDYWHRFTEKAAKNYRVISLDLLGFGRSPKPRLSGYDYKDHLASIDATLKHYDVDDPFLLMGHSMGALLALRYAVYNKARVEKLLLINTPAMSGPKEVDQTMLKVSLLYNVALRPVTRRIVWPVARISNRFKRLLPTKISRHMNYDDHFFSHSARSRSRSYKNLIRHGDVKTDLGRVEVETLVVSGTKDFGIYLQTLNQAPTRPNVLIEAVDTGHHIPLDMPDLLTRRLETNY